MPEIVLVHGIWHGSWTMLMLRRRLQAAGFKVRCFNYPTWTRDPLKSVDQLREFCQQSNMSELHLAGHSLGGLLILQMLQQTREQALFEGRAVLLGSPLAGSAAALWAEGSAAGRWFLSQARSCLTDGVQVSGLNQDIGMIAGTMPSGIGRLTGTMAGPNDGTVMVSETRSDQLTDHLQIRVSHTGLLLSPEVANQVAYFIQHGQFKTVI